MHWAPLGTNGFFPSYGRHTMSFLVLTDDAALLLDAGTGIGRLAEPDWQERLRRHDTLHIVLTHYHLDHVVGLTYLAGMWQRPVKLYAPSDPLVDAKAPTALAELLRPPYFPRHLDQLEFPVEITPFGGENLEVAGLELSFRRQRHPGGSVGVRVGQNLTYVTDTEVDERTIDFAHRSHTLLHEVWATDEEAADPGFEPRGHSWTGGVAVIAQRAKVQRLVPVHHHPLRSNEDVLEVAAELDRGDAFEVAVVDEGEVYSVPDF